MRSIQPMNAMVSAMNNQSRRVRGRTPRAYGPTMQVDSRTKNQKPWDLNMAIRSSSHERASARSRLLFDRRFNLEIDVEAIVRELLFAVGPHGDDELVALNVEA